MKIGKTLAALTALLACAGMVPVAAVAEDGFIYEGEDAQYIQDGTALTGRFSVTPDILIGDTDGSEAVNARDAAAVLTASVRAASRGTDVGEELLTWNEALASAEEAMRYSDCNGDGDVNALDAARILSHAARLGTTADAEPIGFARYYADADGWLQTGWVTDEEGTSYADEDFKLLTGWNVIADSRYYFDGEGLLLSGGMTTLNGNTYYLGEDGTALCSSWLGLDGNQYYFNSYGAMATGLQEIDGSTYYFGSDGIMQTGLLTVNGSLRYFDADGVMQTGWHTLEGSTYYFNEDGSAQTGWLTLEEGTYYFDSQGVLQTGLQEIDGVLYYFDETGAMQTGWMTLENSTYYFNAEGIAQTGWLTLEESTYYFNEACIMQTGMIQIADSWYYFNESGAMQTGWVTLEDGKHYFNANGVMATGFHVIAEKKYYFDANGVMLTGWQTISDKVYYFGTDGAALTGWQDIGSDRYYFQTDGTAVKGLATISGTRYYFDDASGALRRSATIGWYTTNADGVVTKVLLDTVYISQIGYPTGCESASAVMLLRDAGYDTSIDTFIDTALDKGSLYYSGGVLYGPHPDNAFIGDPRTSYGYGCYAPVITNALNRILTGGDKAVNITGTSISTLLTDYIDKGTPVGFWATINMIESTSGTQWRITGTGELFTWKRNEHCLVLVGYDENYYYFNDPYKANGLKAYARSTVEARYATMGSQAVVIEQAE